MIPKVPKNCIKRHIISSHQKDIKWHRTKSAQKCMASKGIDCIAQKYNASKMHKKYIETKVHKIASAPKCTQKVHCTKSAQTASHQNCIELYRSKNALKGIAKLHKNCTAVKVHKIALLQICIKMQYNCIVTKEYKFLTQNV